MSDYVQLGPDDVIREGDEFYSLQYKWEVVSKSSVGETVGGWLEYRRPRSTLIREALLRVKDDLRREYSPDVYRANFSYIEDALGEQVDQRTAS